MPLDPLSAVTTALEEAHIIPDVIPESLDFHPSSLLVVSWPSADANSADAVDPPNGAEALLGNTLTKAQTKGEPTVAFAPMQTPDGNSSHTLVMTDPDAPSRGDPKWAQWRHWVVSGIKAPPATAFETGNLAAKLTKPASTPYVGPAPPAGTGPHRYALLLFEEPSPDFAIPADVVECQAGVDRRPKWDAAKFAEAYGLKLVGVNFFYVVG
ncbi:PEBP-like protein [Leucogyrophana mollusca]|uniref:PEBP-like protein n=1 Tax=Leucogyrophana mollusca TaxID=85980 RepID=A0ACB8AY40_9AGAM|nr:PEBP-like protein [Leucogyrophana mollusca]